MTDLRRAAIQSLPGEQPILSAPAVSGYRVQKSSSASLPMLFTCIAVVEWIWCDVLQKVSRVVMKIVGDTVFAGRIFRPIDRLMKPCCSET